MAVFRYSGLGPTGAHERGVIEAPDRSAAAELLRARQLQVLSLHDAPATRGLNLQLRLEQKGRAGSQELVMFYRQLGMMLRAGLTIVASLEISQRVSSSGFAQVLKTVQAEIQNGKSLSTAMEAHPRCFPPLVAELVRSAEASGELDSVMDRIAEDTERAIELRRQLISSLSYPTVVVLATVGVTGYLTFGVIPKFAAFFAQSGRQLPDVTLLLIDISNYAMRFGIPAFLLLLAIAVAVFASYRTPAGRARMDALLLNSPLIGGLLQTAEVARFSWATSLLLRSGVTLVSALGVTCRLVNNVALRGALERAAEVVLSGRDLATGFQQPELPILLSHLSSVGEKTGALDHVLEQVGNHYQQILKIRLRQLTAVTEPILIMLIGSIVGFVYYAFVAAMFAA